MGLKRGFRAQFYMVSEFIRDSCFASLLFFIPHSFVSKLLVFLHFVVAVPFVDHPLAIHIAVVLLSISRGQHSALWTKKHKRRAFEYVAATVRMYTIHISVWLSHAHQFQLINKRWLWNKWQVAISTGYMTRDFFPVLFHFLVFLCSCVLLSPPLPLLSLLLMLLLFCVCAHAHAMTLSRHTVNSMRGGKRRTSNRVYRKQCGAHRNQTHCHFSFIFSRDSVVHTHTKCTMSQNDTLSVIKCM